MDVAVASTPYLIQEKESTKTTNFFSRFHNWVVDVKCEYVKKEFLPEVDVFDYPPLETLRHNLESSGYTNEQIEELMNGYARLPKYKTTNQSST